MPIYIQQLKAGGPDMRSPAQRVLGRVLAVAVGAVLLVVGLMFSMLLFAVAAAVALLIGGRLWWKTRALRKQMREAVRSHARDPNDPNFQTPNGRVIEGEVIRD